MKKLHSIPKSLGDILRSIDTIESYLKETMGGRRDFKIYMRNRMMRGAVERELGIIGEATNRIHQVDPQYPLLNARAIISLRNRIVHAYDNLDDITVWTIITKHLPKLKTEVEKLLG
jgi:uncharacterized protein with HEPN domain